MNEKVKAKIDLLTSKPGVYLMKDESGTIIYVGKAKSLIKRVKQYFLRPQEGKVFRMVREIDDFDTIETLNEKEALLLEINLIRKYYPKYNILLKDGKSYPYIALNKKGDPFLKIAYNDKDKNFKYFGPYPNSQACYKTIDLLNKLFPLRKCQHLKTEPCLYYHLGQCLGPCIKKVSEEEYIPLINEINHFLNGDTSKIKEKLKLEMMDASEKLEFERAKEIKDILDSIEKVVIKQNIQLQDHIDRDVISLSTRDGYYSICIMTYRKGNLLGKDVFIMEEFEDYEEEFIENVFQYYLSHNIPKEIIVSNKEIGEKLSYLLERKVISPTRGVKKDLLLIAYENAKNGLDEHFLTARLEDDTLSLLNELGDLLKIKTPLHIELFDNSHLQGSFPIGAMVVFINGVKVPSEYRKFNIQESSGKDDLKSMEEVIRRRYTRLLIEDKKMPDLFTSKATQPDAINLTTEGTGTGNLLCYRDSFGILLFPYLADSYASAKFSRLVNYDLTASADHVAIELVERNLRYLIQNVPISGAQHGNSRCSQRQCGGQRGRKCPHSQWLRPVDGNAFGQA